MNEQNQSAIVLLLKEGLGMGDKGREEKEKGQK